MRFTRSATGLEGVAMSARIKPACRSARIRQRACMLTPAVILRCARLACFRFAAALLICVYCRLLPHLVLRFHSVPTLGFAARESANDSAEARLRVTRRVAVVVIGLLLAVLQADRRPATTPPLVSASAAPAPTPFNPPPPPTGCAGIQLPSAQNGQYTSVRCPPCPIFAHLPASQTHTLARGGGWVKVSSESACAE